MPFSFSSFPSILFLLFFSPRNEYVLFEPAANVSACDFNSQLLQLDPIVDNWALGLGPGLHHSGFAEVTDLAPEKKVDQVAIAGLVGISVTVVDDSSRRS